MTSADALERLRQWVATQLPDARDVAIEGVDRVMFGHSAETLLLTLVWKTVEGEQRREVVLRVRPTPPGLLEPYDLQRQFTILRALERTPVPAPRAFWYEPTGTVLGREFYVMERLGGVVYEGEIPADLARAPERLARMSRSLVETVAAIHAVNVAQLELSSIDGRDHLSHELDHWTAEFRRVQRDRLPALERLATELADRQPAPCPVVTLVHGDAKPGNFAFEGNEVNAAFDWELATVGDPLTDIGWLEFNWNTAGAFTSMSGALSSDEAIALYEKLTGIVAQNRDWYRALAMFKMSVIMLVAAMLFDDEVTDDLRFANMGLAVQPVTSAALAALGFDAPPDSGPVTARRERMRAVRAQLAQNRATRS